ncbi:unnamed protein product [Calypogeia fissa]
MDPVFLPEQELGRGTLCVIYQRFTGIPCRHWTFVRLQSALMKYPVALWDSLLQCAGYTFNRRPNVDQQ